MKYASSLSYLAHFSHFFLSLPQRSQQVHEEAKPFRKKPFMHFDTLAALTDDSPPVAGLHSLSSAPAAPEGESSEAAAVAGAASSSSSVPAVPAAAGADDSDEEDDPSDSDSDGTHQSKVHRSPFYPCPLFPRHSRLILLLGQASRVFSRPSSSSFLLSETQGFRGRGLILSFYLFPRTN